LLSSVRCIRWFGAVFVPLPHICSFSIFYVIINNIYMYQFRSDIHNYIQYKAVHIAHHVLLIIFKIFQTAHTMTLCMSLRNWYMYILLIIT
jgi:hypothetical protein